MSAQHTPGPWFTVPYGDGDSLVICTDATGNHRIAFMAVPGARDHAARARTWKEIKANARLIAAAPELLEALQSVISLMDHLTSHPDDTLDEEQVDELTRARAAIAKAREQAA